MAMAKYTEMADLAKAALPENLEECEVLECHLPAEALWQLDGDASCSHGGWDRGSLHCPVGIMGTAD